MYLRSLQINGNLNKQTSCFWCTSIAIFFFVSRPRPHKCCTYKNISLLFPHDTSIQKTIFFVMKNKSKSHHKNQNLTFTPKTKIIHVINTQGKWSKWPLLHGKEGSRIQTLLFNIYFFTYEIQKRDQTNDDRQENSEQEAPLKVTSGYSLKKRKFQKILESQRPFRNVGYKNKNKREWFRSFTVTVRLF